MTRLYLCAWSVLRPAAEMRLTRTPRKRSRAAEWRARCLRNEDRSSDMRRSRSPACHGEKGLARLRWRECSRDFGLSVNPCKFELKRVCAFVHFPRWIARRSRYPRDDRLLNHFHYPSCPLPPSQPLLRFLDVGLMDHNSRHGTPPQNGQLRKRL